MLKILLFAKFAELVILGLPALNSVDELKPARLPVLKLNGLLAELAIHSS